MENTLEQQVKERAVNNVINLGTANGWGEKTNQLYNDLRKLMIPQSQATENLGRCYNEYSFDVNIDETTYKVVHRVDSSD
jgi:hypothetical protein